MKSIKLNCKLSILISTLAIGVALCAPQQQPSVSTLTAKSSQPLSSSSSTPTKTTSTSSGVSSTSNQASSLASSLSSAASTSNGSPSLVNLKQTVSGNNNNDELDTFDGKNPFSDDSLWQIPIHLVRDLSANENQARPLDSMAKSASEKMAHQEASYSDNDDVDNDGNDDSPILAASLPPQSASSSSSPTVISASTDLKTAAGYHYPTHGYHGGHHGYGGHHGGYGAGHHGGHGDHYGKYFQYASVPYPHAWEFGYRRGNPYHTIERYEHGKGPHFQTKVKWSDKHGGYGVHVWDYNHDDHHSHHHHYDSHSPSHYGGHHGHHGYGH